MWPSRMNGFVMSNMAKAALCVDLRDDCRIWHSFIRAIKRFMHWKRV